LIKKDTENQKVLTEKIWGFGEHMINTVLPMCLTRIVPNDLAKIVEKPRHYLLQVRFLKADGTHLLSGLVCLIFYLLFKCNVDPRPMDDLADESLFVEKFKHSSAF
jgi:hypothetical protein